VSKQVRTYIVVVAVVVVSVATAIGVRAGNPGGPGTAPSATHSYTLDDIYARLANGTAGSQTTFTEPAVGPGTGVMHTLNEIMATAPSADDTNGAITSEVLSGRTFWGLNVASGQWGPQTGSAVASVNPTPPCWDDTNRYVDCGNGTVNDPVTGLVWLENANCFGEMNYVDANAAAAGLNSGECGLSDLSIAGDWRLPTQAEWDATMNIAGGEPGHFRCLAMLGHDPSLTNATGTDCFDAGPQQFTNVQSWYYWSANSLEADPTYAWAADLGEARTVAGRAPKTTATRHYVWPVRAGH
jgi:hypothetical protein